MTHGAARIAMWVSDLFNTTSSELRPAAAFRARFSSGVSFLFRAAPFGLPAPSPPSPSAPASVSASASVPGPPFFGLVGSTPEVYRSLESGVLL